MKKLLDRQGDRQSNFELLRVISMLLIVCHHYGVHSGFELTSAPFCFDKLLLRFLSYGGKMGVDLFILISGYFLVKSEFKAKKAVRIWVQTTVYSVAIAAAFALTGTDMGIRAWIKNCLPIPYSVWWFATTYFLLYALSGFINQFIAALSRERLQKLIALLTVVCSVVPTLLNADMEDSFLLWFFLLYLIAAYVRLYPLEWKPFRHSMAMGLGIYLLTFLSCVVFDLLGERIPIFARNAMYFHTMEKFPILLSSVFLFIGFKDLQVKQSRVINAVAGTTFGIYLIHDNNYIRPFLWKTLLKGSEYYNSGFLFLHAGASILAVFCGCALIDFLYRHTLERFLLTYIYRFMDFLEPKRKRAAASLKSLLRLP